MPIIRTTIGNTMVYEMQYVECRKRGTLRGELTPQQTKPEHTQPLQGRAAGRESLQGPTTVDESGQPQQPSPEAGQGSHNLPIKPEEQPPQPESLESNSSASPIEQRQNDTQPPQAKRKRRKPRSPETRQKISESQLESWHKRWKQQWAERKMKERENRKAEAEETARLIFSIGKIPINR